MTRIDQMMRERREPAAIEGERERDSSRLWKEKREIAADDGEREKR